MGEFWRVMGRFGKGFGRVLGGFWEEFGIFLEGFWFWVGIWDRNMANAGLDWALLEFFLNWTPALVREASQCAGVLQDSSVIEQNP